MCVLLGTGTQSLFHASHKVHLQCHHYHFLSCVCGQMCVQFMWSHVGAGVTVRYLPWLLSFYFDIYIYVLCVYGHSVYMPWSLMIRGQLSWFCPFTMWVPVIQFRLSVFVASSFTGWNISTATFFFFLPYFWDKVSYYIWSSWIWVGWLVNSTKDPPISTLPGVGSQHLVFTVVLGIQSQVFKLVQLSLYQLSPLPLFFF